MRQNDPVYAAARHPGAAERWALGLVLVLTLAVVLFLALFDWNMLRGPIGRWASAKYDREIALTGPSVTHRRPRPAQREPGASSVRLGAASVHPVGRCHRLR